jgi:hypothetical protein
MVDKLSFFSFRKNASQIYEGGKSLIELGELGEICGKSLNHCLLPFPIMVANGMSSLSLDHVNLHTVEPPPYS